MLKMKTTPRIKLPRIQATSFLYTNVPIIDTLNIIKDHVDNDDQFTRKMAIPQAMFLDLVYLVLTTNWYTYNSVLSTNRWRCYGRTSIFNHSRKLYAGSRTNCYINSTTPSKCLGTFCWWHFENIFHHINNFHQNIKFTMEEESNGELVFLDTLLKRHNRTISVLVYRTPKHSDQYLHCSSLVQASCKKSLVSSFPPY